LRFFLLQTRAEPGPGCEMSGGCPEEVIVPGSVFQPQVHPQGLPRLWVNCSLTLQAPSCGPKSQNQETIATLPSPDPNAPQAGAPRLVRCWDKPCTPDREILPLACAQVLLSAPPTTQLPGCLCRMCQGFDSLSLGRLIPTGALERAPEQN
jgi:hypothetical protein